MSAALKLGPLVIAACCGAGLTLLTLQLFGSNTECDHAAGDHTAANHANRVEAQQADLGKHDRLVVAKPSVDEQPQTIELTPSGPATVERPSSRVRSRRTAHRRSAYRRVKRSRAGGLALNDPNASGYWDLKEVPDPFSIDRSQSHKPKRIRSPRRNSSRKAAILDPWAD